MISLITKHRMQPEYSSKAGILPAFFLFVFAALTSDKAHAFDSDAANKTFKKCSACHKIGPNAENAVGPELNGLNGKKAASVDEYKYSKALKQAGTEGLIWNEETLDGFLFKPKKYLKGTKMSFGGLKKENERANLIAWLLHFNSDGSEISDKAAIETSNVALLGATAAAMNADPEYGQYLSAECVTCHTTSGANNGIPSITGWPKEYFIDAMYQYKLEQRKNPVMITVAKRLGDEEMAALAAYFASLHAE